jgi:hypothetical protein
VTPESAEEGDFAETGWLDEEGVEIEKEDGPGYVKGAVKFLRNEGISEASSSAFHKGVWYSRYNDVNYRDGSQQTDSYHLKGFSEKEEREVFKALAGKRR